MGEALRAFERTGRFKVLRTLGRGGCGVVYEAWDGERHEKVALKTLLLLDAGNLYRLKREFRALTDLSHPNLVTLHELFSDGDGWYFTMELVEGRDLLRFVRNARGDAIIANDEFVGSGTDPTSVGVSVTRSSPSRPPGADTVVDVLPVGAAVEGRISSPPPTTVAADPERVRRMLPQLAAGVKALHDAGILHRDIKPSNVMVTADERLVLMDFGIATEVKDGRVSSTDVNVLAGTPAYMAPEQGAGLPLGPAADWYAVGVILFEALSGRLPFNGSTMQMLWEKQQREAPRLSELGIDVPADLDELCSRLLRRDPSERADGVELLRRLGAAPRMSVRPLPAVAPRDTRSLVGRAKELDALRAAFDASRDAGPVVVRVEAPSGLGKSALVHHFLEELEARSDALVLAGRCYERESVPYKAFDSLIDSLTRRLLKMAKHEHERYVPRDGAALARVFPVLDRVPGLSTGRNRAEGNALQLRRRAFAALRELLARICDQRPLVLFIDDLHWTDADSMALLAELTAPPDPPPMLLVLAQRSGEGVVDLLRGVFEPRRGGALLQVHPITLEPLHGDDAQRLAATLLTGDEGGLLARQIAAESGGSPLFVAELAQWVQGDPMRGSKAGLRLDRVVLQRFDDLPEPAQRLCEILAVAGRPIVREVAFDAAGLADDERAAAESALRQARLARLSGDARRSRLEPYHDRIREVLVRSLDPGELRALHGRLADALSAAGEGDPEALYVHFAAAGQTERAASLAIAAVERAQSSLAFDRAADLGAAALELLAEGDADRKRLQRMRADALSNAGRGAEAADAFLVAAEGASEAEQLVMRRRAAEELLRAGYIDRGLELVQVVLAQVGMRLTKHPLAALLKVLVLRAILAMRGLGSKRRDPTTLPATQLQRIDVCYSIASGLGVVDVIRAAEFQTRNLLMCLDAGEPSRICQALATEACFVATQGVRSAARADRIAAELERVAAQHDAPELPGLVDAARFGAAYFSGRFDVATQRGLRCIECLREHGRGGAYWLYVSVHYFWLASLLQVGDLHELRRRFPAALREARDRGNLYLETNLSVGDTNMYWLLEGAPDEALSVVDEAMRRWSHRAFQVQHWYEIHARGQIDLYRGDPRAALRRIDESWASLKRAMQLRVQISRIKALHLRGRAAVASAIVDRGGASGLLARAEADARALQREGGPWSRALSSSLFAGTAGARGDVEAARARLVDAVAAYDEAHLSVHAALARRALGGLTGGDAGRAMHDAAQQHLDDLELRDIERITALLLPGV
ncbi:MAG: protein kinase [Deltaproteobacteria bacterium]|nr:protein kinase [Deltaproteobacteria bacterium]